MSNTTVPAASKAPQDHEFIPVSVSLPGTNKKVSIIDKKGNMTQPENVKLNDPEASKEDILINKLT